MNTSITPQTHIADDLASLDTSFAHPGSVALITDEYRENFIIQEKNYKYRIPCYAGGYSLFGGGAEALEFPRDTLNRELSEEIEIDEIDKLLEESQAWNRFKLDGTFTENGQKQHFSFPIYVYECALPSEWFNKVSCSMLNQDNIHEGKAVLVTADELATLAMSGENDQFIFGIGEVIRTYLSAVLSAEG